MTTYEIPKGKNYKTWESVFDDAQPLEWNAFNTGYIYGALQNNAQPDSFPSNRNPKDRYEYAVMVFQFRHPKYGDVLIDTGFDATYHNNPPYGNLSLTMRIYTKLMNVQYTQQQKGIDLKSQLKKYNIEPSHVFLTHLHADHTGGLPCLPSQTHIHYGKQEKTFLSQVLCGNYFKRKSSIYLLDINKGKSLAPFSSAIDIFGDGSFWAISTPGHSKGHLSYLINTAPIPILIVGDAELTTWAMDDKILVSTMDGKHGKQEVEKSANMIRTFHKNYPNIKIWFSHDENHL
ncbi:MBL fold metallo-hydrolase [Methanococcoides sp. SA1]|nr:MBL fold metallo-hydrolase [Methanococcoides sp. SA1]